MRIIHICVLVLLLSGCANLQTISRTTTLNVPKGVNKGKAIHLDAQQRLVVVNSFQQFCAEPSPDALAAYASSLGLGISDPSNRAASLSQGLQNSVGSIGLRTQSITLMRDALYRMCEAHMNNALSPVQVATLLARSQDLTAVILAVEQLTGAVAAKQIIVTGNTSASSSASLLSNQELLDAARKDEELKKKNVEEAKGVVSKLEEDLAGKEAEISIADTNHKAALADTNATQQQKDDLKLILETKTNERKPIKEKLEAAKKDVGTKEKHLEESTKTRQTIENIRSSALSSAVAGTGGSGDFGIPSQQKQLSKEATEIIAKSVKDMISLVVDKEYTKVGCMAFLTSEFPKDWDTRTNASKSGYEQVLFLCSKIVTEALNQELTEFKTMFDPDDNSEKIKAAVANDPNLQQRIENWLANRSIDISYTFFVNGAGYAAARNQVIQDLSIN